MTKPYFNRMLTGNSGMLGCIDDQGELIRLFWPDMDFPQHIERLLVGVVCEGRWQGTSWLNSGEWAIEQYYLEDTNIAVTVYANEQKQMRVAQYDFALPERDVHTRYYEVENTGASDTDTGFVLYSAAVTTTPYPADVLYDASLSALIHYKHNYYYSISSDRKTIGYQLGANALQNASAGQLSGSDVIGMMQDGALALESKPVPARAKARFALRICLAHDLKKLKILTRNQNRLNPQEDMEITKKFWQSYLDDLLQIKTDNPELNRLYRRSLLVFALMSDKNTGALMAAPEVDEEYTRCGRYAYCWGRDAAFIAAALDRCGMHRAVEEFYKWAARVQDEDGSWQQRYHMDGNLAPSWGLQIDEGGSIIQGIWKHYETCGDKSFLAELWQCVKKGVEFLCDYIDSDTGLPWLSFDLWEERLGEHAYSTAAVCAGIEAGTKIAETLGSEAMTDEASLKEDWKQCPMRWRDTAAGLRKALEIHFWKPEWNYFARSVRVKLNGWGEEMTESKVWLKQNSQSVARDYTLVDGTPDISLLGLSVPFGLYPVDDTCMEATARMLEQELTVAPAGGLMRYRDDRYIGGNPWIISTLWMALYHIGRKSYAKAREYLDWAVKGATEQGLLPEQVGREDGKPAWVIPLTWSHAMFVLVLDGLIEAGEL